MTVSELQPNRRTAAGDNPSGALLQDPVLPNLRTTATLGLRRAAAEPRLRPAHCCRSPAHWCRWAFAPPHKKYLFFFSVRREHRTGYSHHRDYRAPGAATLWTPTLTPPPTPSGCARPPHRLHRSHSTPYPTPSRRTKKPRAPYPSQTPQRRPPQPDSLPGRRTRSPRKHAPEPLLLDG